MKYDSCESVCQLGHRSTNVQMKPFYTVHVARIPHTFSTSPALIVWLIKLK